MLPRKGTALVGTIAIWGVLAVSTAVSQQADTSELLFSNLEELGQALFFDQNLSRNRSQSCATCHDPAQGYVDARGAMPGNAFSLGDDGVSLGDRNAPTAAYAMFSPPFHRSEKGYWIGGQFLDGRAADLAEQAGGPPLNPIEMGMPDESSVVERLTENPDYVSAFQTLFAPDIFDAPQAAYQAMAKSIATYEQTDEFAPFDSKYDRFLRGEYKMTQQEELGMTLFFSEQFTNCNLCHQLKRSPIAKQETFTDYRYYNIGVPRNVAGRAHNGVDPLLVDPGLAGNPQVGGDRAELGKFRTPTLRNVAVTGPYMHNGVFADLRTVILFYNKYNSRAATRQINPETGQPWRAPEVPMTLAVKELTHGPALEDVRIDALVAFLESLTDERYQDLLDP